MRNITSVLSEYKKETYRIQNNCILSVNVQEKLSQLVSRRLGELGISKSDLARRTGLSRSYIGNMANGTAPTQSGEYEPSPDVIEKIALALQVSQSEILEAMNYLPGKDAVDSHDILEGVQIIFQNGNKLSKKKQKEILDLARAIARGVEAKPDDD